MLFSVGRLATRRLASAPFATRSVVSKATAKASYGYAVRAVRSFASESEAKKPAAAKRKQTSTTSAKSTVKAEKAEKAEKTEKKKTSAKKTTKATKDAKKPAPKKRARKVELTPERKAINQRRELKAAALFTKPKALPELPYLLFVTEVTKGKDFAGTPVTQRSTEVAKQYKALSESERQRLATKCIENKAINAREYKAWVESYTPREIVTANLARRLLKKKYNIPKGRLDIIEDTRVPKRPATGYGVFTAERWGSGDFEGLKVVDAFSKLSVEWKNLDASKKQTYMDKSAAEYAKWREVREKILAQ